MSRIFSDKKIQRVLENLYNIQTEKTIGQVKQRGEMGLLFQRGE